MKRNSFNAHPESTTLCGLTDPDISVRKWAFEKIMKSRAHETNQKELLGNKYEIRQYMPPYMKHFDRIHHDYLNFEAEHYKDLVDINRSGSNYFTESPLLKPLSQLDLENCVKGLPLNLPKISSHSQCTEKAVQDTFKAAQDQNCKTHEDLHGKLLVSNDNRKRIRKRGNKSEHLLNSGQKKVKKRKK